MSGSSKKIHFSGLNGIRFFAASAVVFHHCEQYKHWAELPNFWNIPGTLGVFLDAIGNKAVSIFFVLSGFLITYLLLAEIERTKTISLKKFYVRRILRIWPVYYLVVILALFVLPFITAFDDKEAIMFENYPIVVGLYLIILPNLLRASPVTVVGANQAWSVGVEEQFYIIWPLLVRMFHKVFVPFLLIFISLKMGLQWASGYGAEIMAGTNIGSALDKFNWIWDLFRIEQMSVGALGAWYLYKQNKSFLKWIYSPITQLVSIALFASFFLLEYHFLGITLLEGLVFLILIVNVSTNDSFFLKLKSRRYDKLGDMSYGIYMYHTICITLTITGLQKLGLADNIAVFNVLLYTIAYGSTLLFSYLSYEYFETYFLKFKEKFMVVKSASSGSK